MENQNLHELDLLRTQMAELKSLLREQQIVNAQMMRRAMRTDYDRSRRDTKGAVCMAAAAIVIALFLLPSIGMPWPFTVFTVLYMAVAIAGSIYQLRRYQSDDLMQGSLTRVARHIVAVRRFGQRWLVCCVPVLIVWIALFFHLMARRVDADLFSGMALGGIIGGVTGLTLGIVQYVQNQRRYRRILRQIDEIEGTRPVAG